MRENLVTEEDLRDQHISLQFTPCYVIAQQRPHSTCNKFNLLSFHKCIMTLQPVISEIAEVATSLLFKAVLGGHPHAGASGVTGS